MTDYEMVYLFQQFLDAGMSFLENFTATVFAVLVAGYLVGPKLTRTMVVIVIGLFTLLTIIQGFNIAGACTDAANLGLEIVKVRDNADSSLGWIFMGGSIELFPYFPLALLFLVITAYIATIVFFFQARHRPQEVTQ